jgi:hypothetical protein
VTQVGSKSVQSFWFIPLLRHVFWNRSRSKKVAESRETSAPSFRKKSRTSAASSSTRLPTDPAGVGQIFFGSGDEGGTGGGNAFAGGPPQHAPHQQNSALSPGALLKASKRIQELFGASGDQEAINRPNIDWQDQIHREILRGLRNISETP